MDSDKLLNKSIWILNKFLEESNGLAKLINLTNEMIETLSIIKKCTNCKERFFDRFENSSFDELINILEKPFKNLNQKVSELNGLLTKEDIHLNTVLLCDGCKDEKFKKSTEKCGNEELARFLYECKKEADDDDYNYIKWIPFNEFKNIQDLAKDGFGEVQK